MGRGRRALSPHLEAEIRIPKPETRTKPELRNPKARISDGLRSSAFGLRISFGLQASGFGFQVQGFNARKLIRRMLSPALSLRSALRLPILEHPLVPIRAEDRAEGHVLFVGLQHVEQLHRLLWSHPEHLGALLVGVFLIVLLLLIR